MHPVFSVYELLSHIFTLLLGDKPYAAKGTKRDLAILARTCKVFSGVALPILWKDLVEVISLFSLLHAVRTVKIQVGEHLVPTLVSVDSLF
jgi:hypothetical protein